MQRSSPTTIPRCFPTRNNTVLRRNGCRSFAIQKIGTHDGIFHCDEALACFILRNTARFRNAWIIRTRDESILNTLDVVVDVGGIYDSEKLRFDHHQRGFDERFQFSQDGKESKVMLSSAGLIYRHFGKEALGRILKDFNLTPDCLNALYERIYDEMIEGIDAKDNGISIRETKQGSKRGVCYFDCTDLTSRVGRLNRHWQSPPEMTEAGQFKKAMRICGQDFRELAFYFATKWLPARKHVHQAIKTAKNVSTTGEVIFLQTGCPWIRLFHDMEAKMGIKGKLKYCIYQDNGTAAEYRIQAIPVDKKTSTIRLPFPSEWTGLKGMDLVNVCQIEGSVFVHRNGFLAGNKTKKGAIKMAEASLRCAR